MPNFASVNPSPLSRGIIIASCAVLIGFGIAAHYNTSSGQRLKDMMYTVPHHHIDWKNIITPSSNANKKSRVVLVV
ncbi:hypothetical protein C1645_779720 [Glomus cerebriforme]|uniref:Uncharacterized protein n=1 Tax=Glomus cerebriforme TaxID=658196 RepID=A0A397SUL9_9GLOM|nr:hypothetical protein C1645_779720 [Glomus cerebriforme]